MQVSRGHPSLNQQNSSCFLKIKPEIQSIAVRSISLYCTYRHNFQVFFFLNDGYFEQRATLCCRKCEPDQHPIPGQERSLQRRRCTFTRMLRLRPCPAGSPSRARPREGASRSFSPRLHSNGPEKRVARPSRSELLDLLPVLCPRPPLKNWTVIGCPAN